MPIKATCACGASFAARDELAGRTVACPKCKQALKIPAAQPAQPAPPAAPHANADLFDGLGLMARDTTQPRCPGCAADLPPNAVLCVKCGYNIKLGRRMQTISMSGETPSAAGDGGHGNVTGMLMSRAAAAAEEDAVAEQAKTKEGLPVWVLIAGLGACILFGLVMSLIPQAMALQGTGVVLIVANFLLVLFAAIAVFIQALQKNPALGIAALVGDLVIIAVAISMILFIDEETMPRSAVRFILMLVGVCTTLYSYTDPEGCAKFAFYLQIAYGLRFVGLILLLVGALVSAAEDDSQGSSLPAPPAIIAVATAGTDRIKRLN